MEGGRQLSLIEVENVSKKFRYNVKKGINFMKRKNIFEEKIAVDNISFRIEVGEIVGYIGQNGAGKSTTIKMLTGILNPTTGTISIAGKDPFINKRENAMQMGVLFGQRTQLWWDLPLIDTLELHRHMYRLSKLDYEYQVKLLFEVLDLDEINKVPIRQLSLGQRMRCELAVTLLHRPAILYLDEPTIGMDVVVKEKIREYLLKLHKKENVTILLTTHDLSEIERICNRVIIINHGQLLFDGSIETLRQQYMPNALVTLKYEGNLDKRIEQRLSNYTKVDDGQINFTINRKNGESKILTDLYRHCDVIDLKIEEPPIEDIVRQLYRGE